MYFLQMESNTQTASVSTEAPGEVQAHTAEPEKPGCIEEALSQPKKDSKCNNSCCG